MREYRLKYQQFTEVEVVGAKVEVHNSRIEYMRQYRRNQRLRAAEDNERVIRRHRLDDEVETNSWGSIWRKYSLTKSEERLVSSRHVFQSSWTHKGLSRKYRSKGGIVNVPVDVDTAVPSLSCNLNGTNTIYLSLSRRMCYVKDYIRSNTSPAKVWREIIFLQSTPLYQEYNITLSNDWIEDITKSNTEIARTDGAEGQDNSAEEIVEGELEDHGNQRTVLLSDHEATRPSSGNGRIPLSALTVRGSDFLSFPKIFCGQRLSIPENVFCSSLTKSISRRVRRAARAVNYIL
ncbi:hypothetical protein PHYBLDRAFT_71167 [Phycomyces blakesleeanus NRRL 1555(-)]|uniref:Uncharacterized protein n=1 Tax=Phycomyces blakesleeanus (strain ATCC 8743b / DSM 1359 / FGSC 10004 / NBRC 33097 / NRRL 1555) TaxID=763407 RepID=A0A162ZER6_PHYB8|nr:hypothetical protein PHYBLDRAFT_71167 [Phycomyces blakesleeanus NRRL 1555(-)]OAD66251.1 hypothetical protein PHYBLDRAFT_71167 [Phycomyces blakesleeanus NRRL 1555(-)]|eukprot:XP_018284291.1 hypothetical protein PHYBLDRAFT_71167 [Phycomyces blakesleeanus NRRL 1555(-)]